MIPIPENNFDHNTNHEMDFKNHQQYPTVMLISLTVYFDAESLMVCCIDLLHGSNFLYYPVSNYTFLILIKTHKKDSCYTLVCTQQMIKTT